MSPAKIIFHKLKNQKKVLKETPVEEKKLCLAKESAVIAGDIYLPTTCKLYLTSVPGDTVTQGLTVSGINPYRNNDAQSAGVSGLLPFLLTHSQEHSLGRSSLSHL